MNDAVCLVLGTMDRFFPPYEKQKWASVEGGDGIYRGEELSHRPSKITHLWHVARMVNTGLQGLVLT